MMTYPPSSPERWQDRCPARPPQRRSGVPGSMRAIRADHKFAPASKPPRCVAPDLRQVAASAIGSGAPTRRRRNDFIRRCPQQTGPMPEAIAVSTAHSGTAPQNSGAMAPMRISRVLASPEWAPLPGWQSAVSVLAGSIAYAGQRGGLCAEKVCGAQPPHEEDRAQYSIMLQRRPDVTTRAASKAAMTAFSVSETTRHPPSAICRKNTDALEAARVAKSPDRP